MQKMRMTMAVALGALMTVSMARGAQVFVDPTLTAAAQDAQETAFLAATGALTKIDFESFNAGDIVLPGSYPGISFGKPDGGDVHILTPNPNFAPRGNDSLFPLVSGVVGNPTPMEDIQAVLTTPQYAFGLWLIDSEFDTMPPSEKIQFYDASNMLIAEFGYPHSDAISNPGNPPANYFFGYISDTPIAKVVMAEAETGELFVEDTGWDDVYFGVPEPATAGLMLLAGAFALRRRR